MDRQNISSGTVWEDRVGYSRAVRVGPFVYVTGTIAADESSAIIAAGDPQAQTIAAIEKIELALNEAGASLQDVVRTRLFVINIDRDWEAIGEGHRACFGDVRPATSMIQVSGLIIPEALVEIEADAVIRDQSC